MRRTLIATSFDSFFRHGEKLTRKNMRQQCATRIVVVCRAENVVSEETSTRSVFESVFVQRRQTASVNEKLSARTTVQNGGGRTSIAAGHRTTGIQGTRSSVVLRCVFQGLFQLRNEHTACRRDIGLTSRIAEFLISLRHGCSDCLRLLRQMPKRHFLAVFPSRWRW